MIKMKTPDPARAEQFEQNARIDNLNDLKGAQ